MTKIYIFIFALIFILGCGEKIPENIKSILKKKCNSCHSYKIYKKVKNNSIDNWNLILQRMIQKGAHLSTTEYKIILNYFSTKNHK